MTTILKETQVSKAVGLNNLSGHFKKYGAKFLSKTISDIDNLSLPLKKFLTLVK